MGKCGETGGGQPGVNMGEWGKTRFTRGEHW